MNTYQIIIKATAILPYVTDKVLGYFYNNNSLSGVAVPADKRTMEDVEAVHHREHAVPLEHCTRGYEALGIYACRDAPRCIRYEVLGLRH